MSALPPRAAEKRDVPGSSSWGSCDRTHLQQDLDGGPFRLLAKPCTTLPKLPAGRAEFPISTIGSEYVVGGQNLPSHIELYFHAPWALTLELAMTNVKFPRRKFLHLAAGAAALPAVSRFAWAQTYPTRPVRIIVGFPPGGPNDIFARLLGRHLSERLGQPVIIENRPGAASNIGVEAVVRAAPDGHTLVLLSTANPINSSLYHKLSFDLLRDIAPVAGIATVPNVLEVNPDLPIKSVPELIRYAKANPGKLSFASGGSGTTAHLAGELFKMAAGVDMLHVPYRGAAPAMTDLMGGQVQAMFDYLPSAVEYVKSGKLRALAVTTKVPSPVLPDTPTIDQFIPGYDVSTWFGIGVPRETPAEVAHTLNREITASVSSTEMQAELAKLGAERLALSPEDFRSLLERETEKWRRVLQAINLKAD